MHCSTTLRRHRRHCQVEMDKEVPAAEVDGMAEQIARLMEVDDLQAEWQAAAEASDEVERLLRAV